MRMLIAAIAATLTVAGCTKSSAPTNNVQELGAAVFTANEGGTTLSRIDLATGEVNEIDIGLEPHNVQISFDGMLALAVGIGGHAHGSAGAEGMLVVHDVRRTSSEHLAAIETGDHPAHVVVDARGEFAYVTDSETNEVLVVELGRRAVVATIPAGEYPHGLRLSPDGRELYVACVVANAISVIDIASRTEVERIVVGPAPVQVAFTPDGARLFATLRDANAVAAIDTRTRAVVDTIAVGRGPIQLVVTPDARLVVVANQGTEAEPDSTVSIIDVATGDVARTITTGAGAHGVTVSTDGRYAYIANQFANTVSEIDLDQLRVSRTFKVGSRPNGISFRNR
jgi:YVTN family beta-propeller protein